MLSRVCVCGEGLLSGWEGCGGEASVARAAEQLLFQGLHCDEFEEQNNAGGRSVGFGGDSFIAERWAEHAWLALSVNTALPCAMGCVILAASGRWGLRAVWTHVVRDWFRGAFVYSHSIPHVSATRVQLCSHSLKPSSS